MSTWEERMAARARERVEAATEQEALRLAPELARDEAWDKFCRTRGGWGAGSDGLWHGAPIYHGNMIVSAVDGRMNGPFTIALTDEYLKEVQAHEGEPCPICRDAGQQVL